MSNSSDRIGALTQARLRPGHLPLRRSRVRPRASSSRSTARNEVLQDYHALLARSRTNQLRFNAALLLGALVIVGLAIFTALKLADRLVRPVGQLVTAAGRIEEGDFSARVPVANTEDEIQTLATAFNRMTGRLEEQTGALVAANTQLETRRAFIEAVLSSVTAGVIALDAEQPHPADQPLGRDAAAAGEQADFEGNALADVSPELDEFMRGEQREANVLLPSAPASGRLAVKRVRYQDGAVLTFDDITDQLSRPAPRRLVGHRAPHRARDQEPADPDPARRRAAAAALRQGDRSPTPRRSSG